MTQETMWQDWGAPGPRPWYRPIWEETYHEFTFALGGALWTELNDQQPRESFPTDEGFGSLQSWGPSFEFAYHGRVTDLGPGRLWLGGEFGWASWGERKDFDVVLPSGERIYDDVYADVVRLTFSARWEVPLQDVGLFVGAGGGPYWLSINEEDWYYYYDEIVDDSTFGGYVNAGLDIPVSDFFGLRIEDQVHFLSFDGLDRFTPGNDDLDGPINVIQLGLVFRF